MRNATFFSSVILAATLFVAGCSTPQHAVTDPSADVRPHAQSDSLECWRGQQYMPDPWCMIRHTEGPQHGFIARQTLGGATSILYISDTGATSVVRASVWSGTSPVWIPGYSAVGFDTKRSGWVDHVEGIGSRGGDPFRIDTFVSGGPQFRVFEPMFGDQLGELADLFQWTSDYVGDPTVYIRSWNRSRFSLGAYGDPYHCRATSDLEWIVAQATNVEGIVLINRMAGTTEQVIGGNASEPDIAADGRIAYVESVGNGRTAIVVVRLGERGHPKTIARFNAPGRTTCQSPVFSPDGNSVAFIATDLDHQWSAIHVRPIHERPAAEPIIVPGELAHLDWL